MATPLAIALRKQAALDRIVKALDIDPTVQGRDPAMSEVVLLERIADALPQRKATPKKAAKDDD